MALEDPVSYQLTSKKPSRQALRTLVLLSEMVTNIGNNAEFVLPKLPADADQRQRFVDMIEEWMETEPDVVEDTEKISWKIEREALMNLTDYILENQYEIDIELKQLGTVQHNITFTLCDLLDSLNPPPIPAEKKQDRLALVVNSTSPRFSGPGDPKREKEKKKIIFKKKKNIENHLYNSSE